MPPETAPSQDDELNVDREWKPPFPVVGVGASAGGLAAFESFFLGMPRDLEPGMAFVLLQHLAPDHITLLPELVQRFTKMPVHEAKDGEALLANCVYTIPANCELAIFKGCLHVLAPVEDRGLRLPIDHFFASLAHDSGTLSAGIVLSGTGSDGSMGVRAIKEAGGLTLAQNVDSAEFDGMPRAAIATGLVDYVVPAVAMAEQLIAHFSKLGEWQATGSKVFSESNMASFQKIFMLLRLQVGHDFSQYKIGTIQRRIERRMAVHQIALVDEYVKFLQQTPGETELLFQDFLIGVTQFFRDTYAFEGLRAQLESRLLTHIDDGRTVRVWAAGCSTGEEAYSVAIVLQECLDELKRNVTLQIFATDIDRRAVAIARTGRYPASIDVDVSSQRLSRFFTAELGGQGYRIHKSIRDMLVFSEQDLVKDPPFSRLDLIICRNLMIYFQPELQRKLIPLFHYALNSGGMLFLGNSEGIGDYADLFHVVDRKAKLYVRIDDLAGARRVTPGHLLPTAMPLSARTLEPRVTNKSTFPMRLSLKDITERALMLHIFSAAALVNGQGDILYLHGRTGIYLEMNPGEAGVNNILKMARKGLRTELARALHTVTRTREAAFADDLSLVLEDRTALAHLAVLPVELTPEAAAGPALTDASSASLYLVVLTEVPAPSDSATKGLVKEGTRLAPDLDDALGRISALQAELQVKEDYIQSTQEELESSNEELKSSNEEMQSVNEELQSTNEELETSKEELQSLNEELATVNVELHNKLTDLSRANNDMNNLLSGTGIATVFVDQKMRILRFTPTAAQLINLISSDVGRPVGHIVSNLVGYDTLVRDAQHVLDTLVGRELQVQTVLGRWFTMRMRPYRTLDNVIEGVVITFEDITEIRRVQLELAGANKLARLAVVVRDSHDAITVQDLQGQTLAWNPGAERLYGWREEQALKLNIRDRIPAELQDDAIGRLLQLSRSEVLEPYATQRKRDDGVVVNVWITSTALVNEAGQVYAIATTERGRTG